MRNIRRDARRCSSSNSKDRAKSVAADRVRLDAIIAASDPVEARPARDAEERLAIWKGRKSAFSAVGRLSPDFIVQDGVVPRRRTGRSVAAHR